ncbi:MAG: hypothetical protein H6605_07490 [Flavobacteriales bacterium]|nr:hypothetical protein [Flavobacteriales bacterium]
MKFGFIGGTPRGFSLLKELLRNNHKPEFCIVLKEDDHEILKVSDEMLEVSQSHNIPNEKKKKLVASDYARIENGDLDFIIVCGWRTLIDPKVNQFIRIGMIAAHDSLLPKYRGFAPLNWAMINGEKETGVTLFVINDGEVDSGDVISSMKVNIEDSDDINSVYSKVIDATIRCYLKMIQDYQKNGKLKMHSQKESEATYTCKRTPEDGRIDWNRSSAEVYNLIRALVHPYSGAFFYYDSVKYTVGSASPGPKNNKVFAGRIPGRVVAIYPEGIEVLCGSGTIMIHNFYIESLKGVHAANTIFKSITLKFN